MRLVNRQGGSARTVENPPAVLGSGEDGTVEVGAAAVEVALQSAFGFAARGFGQGVSVDEAAAVAHAVAGVEAVQVIELHRADTPSPLFVPRVFAELPVASLTGEPLAAELLVLDDAHVKLELMT